MFKLEIKTGGAAFCDPMTGEHDEYFEIKEICHILRKIEQDIWNEGNGSCVDINGNVVGRWSR